MTMKEPENLGELLASQRLQANLSTADVADKLHLTVSLIEKIESNQFGATGLAPMFLRGHIRSYAKLISIPDDIIAKACVHAGLNNDSPGEITPEQHSKPINIQAYPKKRIANVIAYFAIVIILVIGATAWHHHHKASATTTTKNSKPHKLQLTSEHTITPKIASNNVTISAALPEQGIPDSKLVRIKGE